MVDLYIKLNPGNNFIFPFKLVPQLLIGDIEGAWETMEKTKLVHPNFEKLNKPFEDAVVYMEQTKTETWKSTQVHFAHNKVRP